MTITVSGVLHVTKNRQILTNPLDPMEPRGYNLYLFNLNEETDRHAYIGNVTVEAGTGVAEREWQHNLDMERAASLEVISKATQNLAVSMAQTNCNITSILRSQERMLTKQDVLLESLTRRK